MVLGCTVQYCMGLLVTTRHWVVLGCTGPGELVGTEGTGGSGGTVGYQRVLGTTCGATGWTWG